MWSNGVISPSTTLTCDGTAGLFSYSGNSCTFRIDQTGNLNFYKIKITLTLTLRQLSTKEIVFVGLRIYMAVDLIIIAIIRKAF